MIDNHAEHTQKGNARLCVRASFDAPDPEQSGAGAFQRLRDPKLETCLKFTGNGYE